jgi:hypothetical protein
MRRNPRGPLTASPSKRRVHAALLRIEPASPSVRGAAARAAARASPRPAAAKRSPARRPARASPRAAGGSKPGGSSVYFSADTADLVQRRVAQWQGEAQGLGDRGLGDAGLGDRGLGDPADPASRSRWRLEAARALRTPDVAAPASPMRSPARSPPQRMPPPTPKPGAERRSPTRRSTSVESLEPLRAAERGPRDSEASESEYDYEYEYESRSPGRPAPTLSGASPGSARGTAGAAGRVSDAAPQTLPARYQTIALARAEEDEGAWFTSSDGSSSSDETGTTT